MQHTHVIYHILSSPLSLDGKLDLWAVEVLAELVTHCNQLSSEWAEEKKVCTGQIWSILKMNSYKQRGKWNCSSQSSPHLTFSWQTRDGKGRTQRKKWGRQSEASLGSTLGCEFWAGLKETEMESPHGPLLPWVNTLIRCSCLQMNSGGVGSKSPKHTRSALELKVGWPLRAFTYFLSGQKETK